MEPTNEGGDKMLIAELDGKISHNNPPKQRMEDILTSYTLSLFRYLNNLQVPEKFLQRAVNIKGQNLVLERLQEGRVYFWPKFKFSGTGYREPDALLFLDEGNGNRLGVMVEAKYDSGLSNIIQKDNDIIEEIDSEEAVPSIKFGHQLADQYCCIKCGKWNSKEESQKELAETNRKVLIYITAHFELPRVDLEEAIMTIEKSRKCSKECHDQAENDIYWISWRALYDVIHKETLQVYSKGEQNYINDVFEMLKIRGLVPFYTTFQDLISIDAYKGLFENLIANQSIFELKLWQGLKNSAHYHSIFQVDKNL